MNITTNNTKAAVLPVVTPRTPEEIERQLRIAEAVSNAFLEAALLKRIRTPAVLVKR